MQEKFITSQADVEVHHKVDLRDGIVDEESKQQFKEVCAHYQDVFGVNSSDIEKRGLGTMDIDTGYSPPIHKNHIHCH